MRSKAQKTKRLYRRDTFVIKSRAEAKYKRPYKLREVSKDVVDGDYEYHMFFHKKRIRWMEASIITKEIVEFVKANFTGDYKIMYHSKERIIDRIKFNDDSNLMMFMLVHPDKPNKLFKVV